MASAFPASFVEPGPALRDAGRVHAPSLLSLLLLGACAAAPTADAPRTIARPNVPVVFALPPGTRVVAELAAGVPDEPTWRGAGVWWREALRLSLTLEVHDGQARDLPTLELTIDPTSQTLAAVWRQGTTERALAGGNFRDRDLATAIDALAWATRLALGEDAQAPMAIAAGTSALATVVLAVSDAQDLLRDGGFAACRRILQNARARDGACPFVLEGLAAVALLHGELALAERIALEGLSYTQRLLPSTQHRLARTLLLTRASSGSHDAARCDRDLLALAAAGQRERPHDPQPQLSQALASNFLGDFATARTLLLALQPRLPENPILLYHLGWAMLGSGDATAAAEHFASAAVRLPATWVLLPRAVALFDSQQHDALHDLLQTARADAEANHETVVYDLLRMQAAHALLRGDLATARAHLLTTLTWLLKNPQTLAQRVGEFAEQGALAVRLDAAAEFPSMLAAIQQQHAGSEIADVCTYLAAMVEVHRRHERALAAEETLRRGGDSPWSSLLAAYAHELRGEVADMQAALARAAALASSPMTKALLARGLHTAGRTTEASQLLATLRAEMNTKSLRAPCRHAILGPELAFAFLDP